ncbi:ferredoxin-thioredoxin reductase catalytic chain, chloroplastic-like [Camellia sinensis]|uniref:ferredoxin-thioredoxin reductase catalytic chain, chloroplastic-like n=1 Tax=Camellia sinensis TaxID=4442 RepID=UPI001036834F|nr:ferredoxin-thioredoxin reductase catalytic chain, chloroplastic-like [Camellia sinensis]
MRALQASTSSSYGVGISSFASAAPRRLRLRHHHVILAKVEPSDKSVEIMRKFSELYAHKSGTYFCVDKGVTSVVIKLSISNLGT